MDIQRARQIIESPEKITVIYQGTPVWIDNVDVAAEMVHVHIEANPNDKKIVSAQYLEE
jgi:small acid-soluble spore protein H (minor)